MRPEGSNGMRRIALVMALALVLVLAFASVASAHNAGPCNDSGEPGNSDYAIHHIKAAAQAGALGNDGHKPGTHQGFSVCNPSGR